MGILKRLKMSQKATYPLKQGYEALRLYRSIMKLHLKKMPEELRNLGDLYIKQEFRLHLDKSDEEQMTKFMKGWEQYKMQVEQMNMTTKRNVKKSIMDPDLDNLMKDKLTEEQQETLGEFKKVIYDHE